MVVTSWLPGKRKRLGLVGTLIYAKAEDDRARRDALLHELRDLARTYPDDAAVRKSLALA